MFRNFILVAISFFLLFCNTANGYSDCGSKVGSIISINVSNCDNESRCILKRNSNTTIVIEFKTNVESDSVKAVVHGVILDVPIPFNLPNSDGCSSGVSCPISAGQAYKYSTVLPVLGSYPRVTVDVKWELQDKDGQDIVCLMIPSKIK